MANTRLFFYGTDKGNTESHSLEIYVLQNEIFIEIDDNIGNQNACITLDKSTAIKFSKEIRRQIALLENEEV